MVALGIRKHSPPALVRARCLVRCYGSRCEDRVCRVPARYDHFSAIRSVSWRSFLSRERWLREFAGVSFDSDYSGEGDASFLLFFEVCWYFSARGHHLWSSRILLTNYFLLLAVCNARCRCRRVSRRSLRVPNYAQRPSLVGLHRPLARCLLFGNLRSMLPPQRGQRATRSFSNTLVRCMS
jgi:hypothetical protein